MTSKITPEAAYRCEDLTPREQLIAYRYGLEVQAALDDLERKLRDRRVAKLAVSFPDRRRDADDLGHGL